MNVNRSDNALNRKTVNNVENLQPVDERLKESSRVDMSPAMKMFYQDYMQKILMSDGTDPDNQPEW